MLVKLKSLHSSKEDTWNKGKRKLEKGMWKTSSSEEEGEYNKLFI